jgi:hypothetical protein
LGVSLGGRAGSLVVFASHARTRELVGDKPNWKLVPAQDVAGAQIIGAITAVRPGGRGRPAALIDNESESLHQAEQLNGGVFTLLGQREATRVVPVTFVGHGDCHSACQ